MARINWHQWLSAMAAVAVGNSRRRTRTGRDMRVEVLENREVLTAPGVVDGFGSPQEDMAFPGTVATLGSDADGDTLTYSVVSGPAHGTLNLNADGTFTYTPALNYDGDDSFTFMANDGTTDSNVGTFALTITPINDPLTLVLPSAALQVSRTTSPVRIDPAASVDDVDTVVNYGKTQTRTTIYTGNTTADNAKGRIVLKVRSEAPGPGALNVKGAKIFLNGSDTAIATFSGGSLGRSLIINFTSSATQADVNQVLQQISFQASKKATLGIRTLKMTVSAGNQKTSAPKVVTVVP